MKDNPKLAKFDLLRLPRLSVMAVSEEQWKVIERMGRK
jgi:predicted RNA-binding protein with PUA-like domain